MAEYSYDDTGSVFGFFLITLLAAVLIPFTYYSYRKSVNKHLEIKREHSYGTEQDVLKQKSLVSSIQSGVNVVPFSQAKSKDTLSNKISGLLNLSSKNLILIFGWTILILFTIRVFNTSSIEAAIYDPYEVLGISAGAKEPQIKRAMKKLMLKWHPDRNLDNQEEATEKSTQINLAVKALLDPVARANWEQWGHPDGRQSFGVGLALPVGIIQHSVFAVFAYVLGFMVILPLIVARWWSRAKSVTRSDVYKRTVSTFFKDRKSVISENVYSVYQLISGAEEFESIIRLDDFQSESFLAFAEEVKKHLIADLEPSTRDEVLEKELPLINTHIQSITLPSDALAYKVNVLILSQIFRVDACKYSKKLAQEQADVVVAMPKLLRVAVDILGVSEPFPIVSLIVTASQRFYQAVSAKVPAICAVPYLDEYSVKTELNTSNLPNSTTNVNITSPQQLLDLPVSQQRHLLSRFLDKSKTETILKILPEFPKIQIKQAKFYVPGLPVVVPKALVTLNVAIELPKINNLKNEKGYKGPELDNGEVIEVPKRGRIEETEKLPVYAPYYPSTKYGITYIFLTRQGNETGGPSVLLSFAQLDNLYVGGSLRVAKLQFEAPPSPGEWNFNIIVVNDSYLGSLNYVTEKLVVEPASALPEEEEDDDISDPDEDSIAGQMALMKGRKIKKAKKSRPTSSSSKSSSSQSAGAVASVASAAVGAKLNELKSKRAKKNKTKQDAEVTSPTSPISPSANPNITKVKKRIANDRKKAFDELKKQKQDGAVSPVSRDEEDNIREDIYGRDVNDSDLVDSDSDSDYDDDQEYDNEEEETFADHDFVE